MHGLAACSAQEPDDPEAAGREAILALEDIRAAVRRIEMFAAQHRDDRDDPLLAAAIPRVTDAAIAAEQLTAREILMEEVKADWYARGRADMAREVADRQRLRPVS